jgi:hypothetical protein
VGVGKKQKLSIRVGHEEQSVDWRRSVAAARVDQRNMDSKKEGNNKISQSLSM